MDFALNDEQRLLQQAARRFFAENHPLSRARLAMPWDDAAQRQLWADMANTGYLSVLVPESDGGLGLGLVEAALVAEETGRQLLNLPWVSSAVLLPLWCQGAADAPRGLRELAAQVMSGQRAWHCMAAGDRWWDHTGQCSDLAIARAGSTAVHWAAVVVNAVPGQVSLDPTLSMAAAPDGSALAWQALSMPAAAVARAQAAQRLMWAAQAIGAGQAALELACDWARGRVQFGRPIGSYQALKHRLADAWMGLDNARLCLWYAAAAFDAGQADADFACAAALWTAIEGAQQATRGCIQVHGGMGFTWEHDAHLYLKRVQHLAVRLGGASAALQQLEALALA